jgi:geranylgeranyl reductase family protein
MASDAPDPEQLSSAAIPDRVWDAAVVGAGPAGGAAAVTLAAGGYHVLLLDREAFPRDKICGDGLLPDALAILGRLGLRQGVTAQGSARRGLSVWSPGRIEAGIPGEYVTLRRRTLDATVVARAVGLGACFARGDVERLEPGPGDLVQLRVLGRDEWVRARFAILATGARTQTLRRFGFPAPPQAPDAVAARCYARSSAQIDDLLISYDREILPGYAWIFPLGDGLYNVGCGLFRGGRRSDLAETFRRFTTSFPPARELLARGSLVTPLRGAPLRCALHSGVPAVRGRVLVAGEALGTTLPFTGEGVGKALETGERAGRVAAAALQADDPELLRGYPRDLARDLAPRYAGYRHAEQWLSHGWACDLLARRVRRSRYLRDAAGRVLREEVPPTAVFSVAGLARSLLG